MISTLHGDLDVIATAVDLVVPADSPRRRGTLCRIRGTVLGQPVNMELVADLETGELMLFSPDGFNGSFRLGDLLVAQVTLQLQKAMAERAELGGAHAQAH